MTTDMTVLPGTPSLLDPVIIGVASAYQYLSASLGHEEEIPEHCDPITSQVLLMNTTHDLLAASGRPRAVPVLVGRPTRNVRDALDAASGAMADTAATICRIGDGDQISTDQRRALTAALDDLRDAHQLTFGKPW